MKHFRELTREEKDKVLDQHVNRDMPLFQPMRDNVETMLLANNSFMYTNRLVAMYVDPEIVEGLEI